MKYDYYAILDFGLGQGFFKGFKKETNASNYKYVPLTEARLRDDRDFLSHMTSRSKIILLGHGHAGGSSISSDNHQKRISAEDVAAYLARNLSRVNIKPMVVFEGFGPKAAKANVSDAVFCEDNGKLIRRLTIQNSVCSTADRTQNRVSFLETFFYALSDTWIDANVVGYSTVVIEHSKQSMFGRTITKIVPEGVGDMVNKSDLERRRHYKTLYNADHRNGKLYDKQWKEVLKMDVLNQLMVEIRKDVWDERGKGFFDSKVPEGVRLLRQLFEGHQDLDIAEYNPVKHGQLAKDALNIISRRLSTSFVFTSRNEETDRLYKRYKIALEACV